MNEWNDRVAEVASEIEHYLETHPAAADSLEGIASWWLSRQRISLELNLVLAALARLSDEGVLVRGNTGDKVDPVYRLKSKRH